MQSIRTYEDMGATPVEEDSMSDFYGYDEIPYVIKEYIVPMLKRHLEVDENGNS